MKKLLPEGILREDRTAFLNDRMRKVIPSICIERAKIVTESYKKTEGLPYIIRRAQALKDMLENMTIFIDEEELIVGNHGSRARAALIFPEFGLFTSKELDLMRVTAPLFVDPLTGLNDNLSGKENAVSFKIPSNKDLEIVLK